MWWEKSEITKATFLFKFFSSWELEGLQKLPFSGRLEIYTNDIFDNFGSNTGGFYSGKSSGLLTVLLPI